MESHVAMIKLMDRAHRIRARFENNLPETIWWMFGGGLGWPAPCHVSCSPTPTMRNVRTLQQLIASLSHLYFGLALALALGLSRRQS